jgi:hypothetical protein
MDTFGACGAPVAGLPEDVFLCVPRVDEAGSGIALLETADREAGVLVRFDRSTLPCLVIWKLLGDPRDGYVVGLEPSTNFPNLRTFERTQGRVARLRPGETRTFRVSMELLSGVPGVAAARGLVETIQGATPPRLHRTTGAPFTDD